MKQAIASDRDSLGPAKTAMIAQGRERPAFLDRVVEAGWLMAGAGLPFSFAPWGRNAFELPKALLLWAAVAVMGAAWLVQRKQSDPSALRDNHLNRAVCATLVFACALVLATLLSVNPLVSGLGSYDRMQGLLTLLCYLALFLLIADGLREPAQVDRLLGAIAWGSVPVVAYGLAQAVGLDPLNWQVDESGVIGTLGRSNFLGAYLVLVLPLTVASASRAGDQKGRAAYAVLIGAQLVCLLATGARAAWAGGLAAGFVLILAAAWRRGYRRFAVAGAGLGFSGLLVVVGVLILMPGQQGSIGARAMIWRATWPLIAARPVLGYGLETFGQTFTSVFPPGLVYLQGRAVLVDRAHNLILDTLASTGLLGLVSFAAIVGVALASGLQGLTRSKNRGVSVVLAAALAAAVGHLVETQFSFQVTTTATLFWLTLGVLVAAWRDLPAISSVAVSSQATASQNHVRSRETRRIWVATRGKTGRCLRYALAASLLLTVLPASFVSWQRMRTPAKRSVECLPRALRKALP